jgi:hypothetical protein
MPAEALRTSATATLSCDRQTALRNEKGHPRDTIQSFFEELTSYSDGRSRAVKRCGSTKAPQRSRTAG